MTALQAFQVVAIVAIVIAIAAGAGLMLVYKRLQRYQRNQHAILGSRGTVDIVEHVSVLDEKLGNVRMAVEDLTLAVRDHDVRIDTTLSRVGIVRFDAYQDLGGRQSTAVAFLNSTGDGVIITTVVSRDFARMYVKLLKDGAPDIPLAPEENEAVEQARGSGPFTIRPRVEPEPGQVSSEEPDEEPPRHDQLISAGLPGRRRGHARELDRENRKRRRQGLPLLEGKVMPSAKGWEEAQTPAPAGSLAERFLQEQKAAQRRGSGAEEGVPAPLEESGDEP